MGWSKEGKVKLLIKAYLTLNRNRKITAKEISSWIESNQFGMSNTDVHPNLIVKLVKIGIRNGEPSFRDVHMIKGPKVTEMWLE